MRPQKLLMPFRGWEQEVFVPTEALFSIIPPAVEYEIGHIVAWRLALLSSSCGVSFQSDPLLDFRHDAA